MANHTRINVRAIIQHENNVLVCELAGKHHYFFPGGGVEFKEGAEAALRRELQEELGVKTLSAKFIGAVENLFDNDGSPYHELNLVFAATIDDHSAESKEVGHLAFTWIPIAKLESENVLPKQLVAAVVKWMEDGQMFWVGM